MKKYVVTLALIALPFFGQSQAARQIDSAGVYILDRMADIIGELEAVSFSIETSMDKLDAEQKITTQHSVSQVSMAGPDKMVFHKIGDKGKYGFWYNGAYASMYSFKENNYVTLESPDNIIAMIDALHTRFGVQFPAADFFYPSFTDDILAEFNTLEFLGKKMVDGEECFYIRATNDNMHLQLWVSSNNWNLPKRFILIQKGKQNLRIESVFRNWELNPKLPNTLFEFLPPPNARLIDIMEKS